MNAALTSGTHRGVTWTIERDRPDCVHPLVTITDSEGLFNQVEMPRADDVRVADLIDAELLRRSANKRKRA